MTYVVIVSGPKRSERQARRALSDAGLVAHDETVGHGLAAKVTGDADPTVGFLSCHAEDPDAVHAAVASLNWTLRSHYHAPIPAESQEDMLRRLVREELAAAGSKS